MATPGSVTAAELAYVTANSNYNAVSLDVQTKKNDTERVREELKEAEHAEKIARALLVRTFSAREQAINTLEDAKEDIENARASKFRAVVKESGILTRWPARTEVYKTDDESEEEGCVNATSNSPSYTPNSSPPRSPASSPLLSPSVIDSW